MKKFLLFFAVLMMAVCVLASCVSTPTATTPTTTTTTVLPRFDVTFEGATVESQIVSLGDAVVKPADPEKPGFAFDGWYLDGELYDFENVVTSDITLTAKWTALEYTVTFDGISQTLGWGELATAPDIDLEANKILIGWFTEANGQGTAFDATAPVYANATYYSYVVDGVTVTFADDDGSILKADSFVAGQLTVAPASPDKAAQNKEFIGWFDAAGNEFNPETAYSASVTFTAKYDQYYIVKFVVAGEVKSELRLLAGAAFVAPEADATLDGAEFVGWFDAFGAPYAEGAVATADVVYTARYNVKYTVTFVDEDGNQIGEVQEVFDGGNAIMPTSDTCYYVCDFNKLYGISENTTITLVSVPKTDYKGKEYSTFTNINDDDRMSSTGYVVSYGTFLWNVGQTFSFTDNIAGSVKLKFFAPTNNDGTAKFTEGQSITFTVSIDGYVVKTFSMTAGFVRGYYDCYTNVPAGVHTVTVTVTELVGGIDPSQYGASVGIANIYVNEAVDKYTVTFEGEEIDIPAQTIIAGEKAQKPADPERDGYTFAGWLLGGEAYDFNAAVNGNITLTAAWTEGTKYTVSFIGEGVAIDAQTVNENSVATEPTAPTREGYRFVGWLLDGEAYHFEAPVTASITLVASWELIEYTVTFVDAEGNTIGTSTVVHGKNADLPASSDYFYEFAPANALFKITEDKTIVLTAIAKDGYRNIELSTMSGSGAYDHAGMATTGTLKNYATLLYRVGQEFTFTSEMAGEFKIKFDKFNVGADQSIAFDILVDGVLVNQYVVDSSWVRNFYTVAYIPTAGEHTVTVRITDMPGVSSSNKNWEVALGVCNIIVNEAYVPVPTYTVTFEGEGVTLSPKTVQENTTIAKPVDPERDGYIFAGWLLGGELYDFTTPITADITLTASWTEDTTAPSTYTVTFVDGEGNVISTQTVAPGANATLPEASEGVYVYSPVDALYNITDDKIVVLSILDETLYTKGSFTTNKNQVTLGGGAEASSSGGTFLSKAGTSLTYTATMIGEVRLAYNTMYGTKVQEGQYIDLEIKVDGVVANVIRVGYSESKEVTLCYIADYAEHTITITSIETNIPDAECGRYNRNAQITNISYYVAQ